MISNWYQLLSFDSIEIQLIWNDIDIVIVIYMRYNRPDINSFRDEVRPFYRKA